MKNLFLASIAAVTALALSSCCCLFSSSANSYTTKEKKRICGFNTTTKEVEVASKDSKGGMLTETQIVKTPRYKDVTVINRVKCVTKYCPKKGPCGSTGETTIRMASDQGATGSPHIGLIPTMKVLAP